MRGDGGNHIPRRHRLGQGRGQILNPGGLPGCRLSGPELA